MNEPLPLSVVLVLVCSLQDVAPSAARKRASNTGHMFVTISGLQERTMPALLGINGFGRIGMLVFCAASANPDVQRPLQVSRLHDLPTQVRQCPRVGQRHHRDV